MLSLRSASFKESKPAMHRFLTPPLPPPPPSTTPPPPRPGPKCARAGSYFPGSNQELFETCQRTLRTLYGSSVGCSKTYFYKVWRKYRPNIKPKTGGDFMKCSLCTLFSATLLGAPGIRVSADDALVKRTTDDRARHLGVRP